MMSSVKTKSENLQFVVGAGTQVHRLNADSER
jgi:hypothetical protein